MTDTTSGLRTELEELAARTLNAANRVGELEAELEAEAEKRIVVYLRGFAPHVTAQRAAEKIEAGEHRV